MAEPFGMKIINMDDFSYTNLDGTDMSTMLVTMESMDGHAVVMKCGEMMDQIKSSSADEVVLGPDSDTTGKDGRKKENEGRKEGTVQGSNEGNRKDLWEERKETEEEMTERKEIERKENDGFKMLEGLLIRANRINEILEEAGNPLGRSNDEILTVVETIKAGANDLAFWIFESGKEKFHLREEIRRMKEIERKELERKEMGRKKKKERKDLEKREVERQEMERKEIERKRMELREKLMKELERKRRERKELEKMEVERQETERKEIEKKRMERKETERKALERKEKERKELDKKEAGKKEIERKEMERKEMVGKEVNGEGRMKRMGEEKEKEIGKEILVVLDKVEKKKEGEGNREGNMRRRESKKKGIGWEETSEVLRRRIIELVAQLREVMEENVLLHERIRRKTPPSGKSSIPRMRKIVKETMRDVTVDLSSIEEFPPLPPRDGGMQDRSARKVGPHIGRDTVLLEESGNVRMATPVVSGSEGEWEMVARRSRRGGVVEDDTSSPLLPPRPPMKRELIVAGRFKSVAIPGIVETLCDIGGCSKESIRMGPVRTSSNGSSTVWVQLPVTAALKAAKEGCLRMGRITARVDLLMTRPLQCFKCWSFGHAQYACRSETNRWGACYRCGQKGHLARDCVNTVHCAVCSDAGMETLHRLGGPLCAALKHLGSVVGRGMDRKKVEGKEMERKESERKETNRKEKDRKEEDRREGL